MSWQAFLQMKGIQGESRKSRHHGEIEVMSFSWGANSSNFYNATNFNFHKRSDRASQQLSEACFYGKRFDEAVVTVEAVSESGGLQQSTVFVLKNCLISSFQSSGGSDFYDSIPMDQATIDYEELIEFYFE